MMLYLLLYLALVALAVIAVDWRWPRCSGWTLAIVPALPVPVLIPIAALVWALYLVPPAPPDEIDATGMLIAAVLFLAPLISAVTLVAGLLISGIVAACLRMR